MPMWRRKKAEAATDPELATRFDAILDDVREEADRILAEARRKAETSADVDKAIDHRRLRLLELYETLIARAELVLARLDDAEAGHESLERMTRALTQAAEELTLEVTAAVQPETRSYKPEEAYGPVGRGYLYYTCAPAQAATCAAEWSDLKSVAGKGEVVGFGTRWGKAKPRLRLAGEAPSSPDMYETNIGVVKIGKYAEYPSLVAALKAAIGKK